MSKSLQYNFKTLSNKHFYYYSFIAMNERVFDIFVKTVICFTNMYEAATVGPVVWRMNGAPRSSRRSHFALPLAIQKSFIFFFNYEKK